MEYLRPDVYVEELSTGEKPIQAVSTSTGAFIGVTARGQVGVPVLVTSWTDFVNKFGLGVSTPFIKSSHLPNAVYGFFQNGGARCYVVRVASASAVAGKVTLTGGLEILAREVGDWCNNNLKITIASGVKDSTFDVTVKANGETVEEFIGLSNEKENTNYFAEVINETSKFIAVGTEITESLEELVETAFTGGDNGNTSLADGDFTKGLSALDVVSDVNLVAVPGKTTDVIVKALVDYCNTRNDCFAVVDSPENATMEELKTFREKLSGNGAIYYPWGRILDPLGRNSKSFKNCPPCGHIMGVYARIDSTRGVFKAPAGEECSIRGFSDLTQVVSNNDLDTLNPLGINVILSKPNKGIIVWGARTLHNDPNKRYVSDIRYDMKVTKSLYEGTQSYVWEPNDLMLWSKVDTALRGFLDSEWRNGALRGATSEQAYYVKCDGELNTEDTISKGMLIAEIGYAKQRPSEFVVIRIVQKAS